MSLRIDTQELIPGALVIGGTGLGVPGALIPTTGLHGGSILANDADPGDEAKEFRALVGTPTLPSGAKLFVWEDGTVDLTGVSDGTYIIPYTLFVDGAQVGEPTTTTLTVGVVQVSSDLNLSWTVARPVSSDLDLSWGVIQRLSSDLALSWAVTQRVSADLSISYDVAQRISSDLDLAWTVGSAALVTQVSSDLALSWTVAQQASADLPLAWVVAQQVSADLALAWAVGSELLVTQVSADLALSWAVAAVQVAQKRARVRLTTDGAVPAANLTGLSAAFFDAPLLHQLGAPSAAAQGLSTDSDGYLVLDVSASVLPVGGIGYLVEGNANGNPASEHSGWHGPVTVEAA